MEVASIPETKFRSEEVEAFSAGGTGATAQRSQLGSARFYSICESAVFVSENKSVFNHFLSRMVAFESYTILLIFYNNGSPLIYRLRQIPEEKYQVHFRILTSRPVSGRVHSTSPVLTGDD